MNLFALLAVVFALGIGYVIGMGTSLTANDSLLVARNPALCYADPDSLHSTGGAQ